MRCRCHTDGKVLSRAYNQNTFIMRLYELLQAYDFDEIMPVVVDMFPGTGKFKPQLQQAWDMLLGMKPVLSKKTIAYKIMEGSRSNEHYVGAEDSAFNDPWEVVIGKNLKRERGVDLNDAELVANCLVNICLIGRHPSLFDKAYKILCTPDR